MWTIRNSAAAGLVATAMSLASALPALAGNFVGGSEVRVIEVSGDQTVDILRIPTEGSEVVARLPFNARRITSSPFSDGRWIEVNFQTPDGYAVNGWVRSENFGPDDSVSPTRYHLVGVDNSEVLEVFRRPSEQSAVSGYLPGEADGIVANDSCRRGWCAVHYSNGRKTVRGYVQAEYLAVISQDHVYNEPQVGYADPVYSDPVYPAPRRHKKKGFAYDPNKVYINPVPGTAADSALDPYAEQSQRNGWVRHYRPYSNGVKLKSGNADSISLYSNN